ncbi:hypothetical protein NEUTE1DRAFT_106764 [Neurospora tetrasperma FGSC 2508]|uniref:Uncharacterized protein n=1 Tax=Neurospora tetrasperma (strain FGSC 2508 / ATCC MYA-4615 / P0657) TaxID=510951 RepID=F8MAI3_NEUT8|nr:uncharacterized protein NEUTE1DRAFT_106764 [Neurospora tetrasperma FGSC 2508]EGO60104.1 hypothetical protein NEUTE1DRAFT_106764 [Neurospora tetrasperma FGSC 2508]EGZ75946.1 hypothetical protein NEUTE2DRAFT_137003 [Neurospora tetrasperma FGSC 2509]
MLTSRYRARAPIVNCLLILLALLAILRQATSHQRPRASFHTLNLTNRALSGHQIKSVTSTFKDKNALLLRNLHARSTQRFRVEHNQLEELSGMSSSCNFWQRQNRRRGHFHLCRVQTPPVWDVQQNVDRESESVQAQQAEQAEEGEEDEEGEMEDDEYVYPAECLKGRYTLHVHILVTLTSDIPLHV